MADEPKVNVKIEFGEEQEEIKQMKDKMMILYENMELLNRDFRKYKKKSKQQIQDLTETVDILTKRIDKVVSIRQNLSSGDLRDQLISLLTSSEVVYDELE
jgi:hypothetical protein